MLVRLPVSIVSLANLKSSNFKVLASLVLNQKRFNSCGNVKIAVIGSGPAGFYTTQALIKVIIGQTYFLEIF